MSYTATKRQPVFTPTFTKHDDRFFQAIEDATENASYEDEDNDPLVAWAEEDVEAVFAVFGRHYRQTMESPEEFPSFYLTEVTLDGNKVPQDEVPKAILEALEDYANGDAWYDLQSQNQSYEP